MSHEFDSVNFHAILVEEFDLDYVSRYNDKNEIKFDFMIDYLAKSLTAQLNNNEDIPGIAADRADYCYKKAISAHKSIENNVTNFRAGTTTNATDVFDDFANKAFFGTAGKPKLFTKMITKIIALSKTLPGMPGHIKRLVNSLLQNNQFMDTITEIQIAKFYSSFKSKVYFISTDGSSHNHPHQALLRGLIKGNVDQKNECKVLLTAGNLLRMKNLPDPANWRDYVTFLYLPKSGQATVDFSDGSVDAATLVFDPDARD